MEFVVFARLYVLPAQSLLPTAPLATVLQLVHIFSILDAILSVRQPITTITPHLLVNNV